MAARSPLNDPGAYVVKHLRGVALPSGRLYSPHKLLYLYSHLPLKEALQISLFGSCVEIPPASRIVFRLLKSLNLSSVRTCRKEHL